MTIDKGQKNEQLLVQSSYSPMSVEHQIAVLYCGTHGLLKDLPLGKVTQFEKEFLSSLELSHRDDVLELLKKGVIDDSVTKIIETVAADTVRLLNQ